MTETKKWWQRPEKWANFVGLGILGIGIFMGLDTIMPMVQRVLQMVFQSTLYAVGTATVVAIATWVITSKDLHKLAWYGYETLMRWVTGMLIEIDPIAIMRTFVKDLRANMEDLKKSLGDLKGQQRLLEERIRSTVAEYETNMKMAQQARQNIDKAGMRGALRVYSRKAGRRQESQVTYQGLLNRIKAHIALTEKIQQASALMIEDIEDTVQEETEKRRMIRSSHKAMTASKRILAANEQREMYDRALETVTQDYYTKLGEIEQFMEDSKHFVTTMDLQNGVYEEEALLRLEEWDKRSEALLSGGTGNTKFRVEPSTPLSQEDLEAESPEFEALFKRLDS